MKEKGLTIFGGNNISDVAHKLMSVMFSNNLGTKITLTGRKGTRQGSVPKEGLKENYKRVYKLIFGNLFLIFKLQYCCMTKNIINM